MFNYRCLFCDKKFESKRKGRKFCSGKCGASFKYWDGKKELSTIKKCEHCNKEFEAKQRRTQFCSSLCNANCNYRSKAKQNRTENHRKCKNCGKEFVAHRVNKIFCSQDCQWNHRYKEKRQRSIEINCKECGENFVRRCSGHKYCSVKCRNKSKTCQGYVHTVRREDGTYTSKHRYMIEQSIGRKLETEETVHHKNLDKEDNGIDNLYLFKNKTDHGLCHGSLNKLVKILLSKNIIEFNKNEGIYKFLE